MIELITPEAVKAYALRQHPETTVGRRYVSNACLVAYLMEHIVTYAIRTEYRSYSVGPTYVNIYLKNSRGNILSSKVEALTPFAEYLVKCSDLTGPCNSKVTASELLIYVKHWNIGNSQAYIKELLHSSPERGM